MLLFDRVNMLRGSSTNPHVKVDVILIIYTVLDYGICISQERGKQTAS